MKATNDIDFLSLFWIEAKKIGQKVLEELPKFTQPNIDTKGSKSRLHIVMFSDISGQSWGVSEVLARLHGNSSTLKELADKINYMILKGRANDVKPMLQKICTGRVKKLSQKPAIKDKENGITAMYIGKGHFRNNRKAHTLTEQEINHIKRYFNL